MLQIKRVILSSSRSRRRGLESVGRSRSVNILRRSTMPRVCATIAITRKGGRLLPPSANIKTSLLTPEESVTSAITKNRTSITTRRDMPRRLQSGTKNSLNSLHLKSDFCRWFNWQFFNDIASKVKSNEVTKFSTKRKFIIINRA